MITISEIKSTVKMNHKKRMAVKNKFILLDVGKKNAAKLFGLFYRLYKKVFS